MLSGNFVRPLICTVIFFQPLRVHLKEFWTAVEQNTVWFFLREEKAGGRARALRSVPARYSPFEKQTNQCQFFVDRINHEQSSARVHFYRRQSTCNSLPPVDPSSILTSTGPLQWWVYAV